MVPNTTMVSIKDSIATQLLQAVFSVYLILALSVTLTHMVAEYYDTKNAVINELAAFEGIFEPGLAKGLWDLDEEQIHSLFSGIVQAPVISGVKVIDSEGDKIWGAGIVLDNAGNQIIFDENGLAKPVSAGKVFSDIIDYEFLITYDDEGEDTTVGKGVFYSNSSVVLEKVQYGFIFIIVNSIIKTTALWIIFLWISRRLLTRPLGQLTAGIEQMNTDNMENLLIKVKTAQRNELKMLEIAFNTMVKKLIRAKERTTSLRLFFTKIAEYKSPDLMLHTAFKELSSHIALTSAVLYDPENRKFTDSVRYGDSEIAILVAPTEELLEEIFNEDRKEIAVVNAAAAENPIVDFYKERSVFDLTGGHFIYIQVPTITPQVICMYRKSGLSIFDSAEVEYIKSMISEIKIAHKNIETIRETTRMEGELKTAAAVQQALFPRQIPDLSNIELASFFQSASETGGDWFGFMTEIQNHLYIMIGDVTGHGTPAALVTATASATATIIEKMAILQSTIIENPLPSPGDCLKFLNTAVYEAGAPDFLMTFFMARIDLKTGRMVFSNAGHNFPIIIRNDGTIHHAMNTNVRLGFNEDSEFTEDEMQLEFNDLLFFYTDGLTENMNPKGDMWGDRKLTRFLKRQRQLPAKGIIEALIKKVYDFFEDRPLDDDVTIIACKVTEPFSAPNTAPKS